MRGKLSPSKRSLGRDERGLAVSLALAFSGLVIAALLYILLYSNALDGLLDMTADQTTSSTATGQINLARSIKNNILWVALLYFALFLIIRAVLEGRAS